ncbi:TIM10 [Candida pseudojiufengensis]|uniref:TIM10 n=1 Tax=Candida pseudojiufengensis TaxID=497109 RepID=UPI002224A121|nr:TIM10 [Candida pseudojiufengensis]KAI5965729.1 TIM10 [Candida pseudojiufengensis]
MFGLGGASTPQISSQAKLQAAEAELDMVTGMFNSLVSQCHQKCISKQYSESDITKQESLCLDRCVAKYFETNVQVGENMQKLGQSGQFMGRR